MPEEAGREHRQRRAGPDGHVVGQRRAQERDGPLAVAQRQGDLRLQEPYAARLGLHRRGGLEVLPRQPETQGLLALQGRAHGPVAQVAKALDHLDAQGLEQRHLAPRLGPHEEEARALAEFADRKAAFGGASVEGAAPAGRIGLAGEHQELAPSAAGPEQRAGPQGRHGARRRRRGEQRAHLAFERGLAFGAPGVRGPPRRQVGFSDPQRVDVVDRGLVGLRVLRGLVGLVGLLGLPRPCGRFRARRGRRRGLLGPRDPRYRARAGEQAGPHAPEPHRQEDPQDLSRSPAGRSGTGAGRGVHRPAYTACTSRTSGTN